jgi:hypothetical protein
MRKIFLILLSILTLVPEIKSQSTKVLATRIDSIEAIKQSMRNNSLVSTAYIGLSFKVSFQYSRFLFLLHYLDENDFYELSNDSNPSVRVYSYMALLYLNSNRAKSVRKRLIHDYSETDIQHGCISDRWLVSKVVREIKLWWYGKSSISEIEYRLSGKSPIAEPTFSELLSQHR